jgi:peroxiredoxin
MNQLGELERLSSEFEAHDAQVIAIAYQDEAGAVKTVEASGATYLILADADHQVADLYGAYGLETTFANKTIPAVFVIDRTGHVHWAYVGKTGSDRPEAQLILDNLPK